MPNVVIAGSGPVGLWAAAELRLAGIPVTMLERTAVRERNSRALTVHPRTVELFALRGIETPFLAEGIPLPRGHFGQLDELLDFTALDTPYNFTLALEQVRTEELIEEHLLRLGADFRREHRVTGVRQDADGVDVDVEGPAGPYVERADYVIGCEGVRSPVRESAGIDFPGFDHDFYGVMADVEVSTPPEARMIAFHKVTGGLLMAPLPNGLYRIVVVDPETGDLGRDVPVDFEDFRRRVVKVAGEDFTMHTPHWLSRFGNGTRLADEYRKGRVFVAGDAAHMHFPTGGVGLNVGVQDAMNLGWKLAAEIHGWAPAGLLDSYHDERHAVGARLIESSLAQTALVDAFTPQRHALRDVLAEWLRVVPGLNHTVAERVTAFDVTYAPGRDRAQLAGSRAPDVALELGGTATSLFKLHERGRFVFLDFGDGSVADAVAARWGDRVEVHRGAVADDRPQWRAQSAALIRPDGHVAWASESVAAPGDLAHELAGWLGAPTP